jgi:recombination protein RecA
MRSNLSARPELKQEPKMEKGLLPMPQDPKERSKAIDLALAQIEKQYGKGSIMKLGAKDFVHEVPVISTTSLSIDAALGIGGIPRGRVVEIFGPESSGKTTLALHIVAEAQAKGGLAAYVDAEHALDPEYARKLGVDIDNLLVSQPDSGEQALEITEVLIRSSAIDVLVIDSVAALVPRAELEGEMGDSHVGLQARLMSQALRKLTAIVARSRTCLIFINQIREKIGVMFGNPETTTGGRALKFYASVRLDIRRIGQIKEGDQDIGSRTRVKVVKNKMAPPFKLAEFDILYGQGISRTGDLIDLAITHRLIDKSGAWFSYGETRLGQGRENVRQLLEQNADLRVELDQKLRRILGMIKEPKVQAKEGEDAKAADAAKPAEGAKPAPARDTAAAKPAPAPARETPRPPRGPTPGARA